MAGVLFARFASSLSDAATEPLANANVVQPEMAPVHASPPGGTREPVVTTSTSTTTTATTTTVRPSTTSTSSTSEPPATVRATERRVPANPVPAGQRLAPGQRGPAVRALQKRLAELGYWPGEPNGTYGEPTRQAVLAFQKAEGLKDRDGVADAEVGERLAAASFAWGRSNSGTVVEIDRERQLLMLVEDGAVRWTLTTATGRDLRPGTFAIEREIDGRHETGTGTIHRPKYFDGTLAIQGTGEAPTHPLAGGASLSDAAMDLLWPATEVGTPVLVY